MNVVPRSLKWVMVLSMSTNTMSGLARVPLSPPSIFAVLCCLRSRRKEIQKNVRITNLS